MFGAFFRYNCKTFDIASPIASPKPAEWKFTNAAGSPWIELQCTLNVEFFIALSESESSGTLRKQMEVHKKNNLIGSFILVKHGMFNDANISACVMNIKDWDRTVQPSG